jgi:hypothetical protein
MTIRPCTTVQVPYHQGDWGDYCAVAFSCEDPFFFFFWDAEKASFTEVIKGPRPLVNEAFHQAIGKRPSRRHWAEAHLSTSPSAQPNHFRRGSPRPGPLPRVSAAPAPPPLTRRASQGRRRRIASRPRRPLSAWLPSSLPSLHPLAEAACPFEDAGVLDRPAAGHPRGLLRHDE